MKVSVEQNFETTKPAKADRMAAQREEESTLSRVYIFETVTVCSWLVYAVPFLAGERRKKDAKIKCLSYVQATRAGLLFARWTAKFLNLELVPFDFKLTDFRTANNDLYWFHIFINEMPALQNMIRKSALYQQVQQKVGTGTRFSQYLFKKILEVDPSVALTKRQARLLLLFEAIRSKRQRGEQPVLIIRKTYWFRETETFARDKGVQLLTIEKFNFQIFRFEVAQLPHMKRCYQMGMYHVRRLNNLFRLRKRKGAKSESEKRQAPAHQGPKLAAEYYGQLNLDTPQCFSDLFFWQNSALRGEDILLYSQIAVDPFNDEMNGEIRKHGISPLAMHYKATVTPSVPVFRYKKQDNPELGSIRDLITDSRSYDAQWINKQIANYQRRYDYWKSFFRQNNIKLSVTWYAADTEHIIMADALKAVGGIGAINQRSVESIFMPYSLLSTDVVFGFSALSANIGIDLDSRVNYFVVTGYLGDHRIPLLLPFARDLRDTILKKGAKRIIAYFDEYSFDDERWGLGHGVAREQHAFLFQKVLSDPDLGLILKPKVPSHLRKRLGPVADLMDQAEQTGRCHIFKDGAMHGAYPPAAAALAADIAIHGHLMAGTAGMEAALTGIPSLLIDQEGCSLSNLYKLEKGKVAFDNCEQLWKALEEYWKAPQNVPGFGDWSGVMHEFDPYRDGRAAERMGTYLFWLMEGLKAGRSRETVLGDACERYRKAWGQDKVFSVNC